MHTLPDAARECSSPSCTSSPTCTVLPYPSSDCVTLRPRCRHTPSRTSNALFRTYAWRPVCNLHSSATSKRAGYTLLPSLDRACAVVVILTPRGVSPPSVISDLIVLCTSSPSSDALLMQSIYTHSAGNIHPSYGPTSWYVKACTSPQT